MQAIFRCKSKILSVSYKVRKWSNVCKPAQCTSGRLFVCGWAHSSGCRCFFSAPIKDGGWKNNGVSIATSQTVCVFRPVGCRFSNLWCHGGYECRLQPLRTLTTNQCGMEHFYSRSGSLQLAIGHWMAGTVELFPSLREQGNCRCSPSSFMDEVFAHMMC